MCLEHEFACNGSRENSHVILRAAIPLPPEKQCHFIEYFIDLVHTAGIWLRIELNVFNIENILKLVFAVASC